MKKLWLLVILVLVGCTSETEFSMKSTSLINKNKELHELLGKEYLLPTNVFELDKERASKNVTMRIYSPKGKELLSVTKSDVLPDYSTYNDYEQYIVLDLSYLHNANNEKLPYKTNMSLAYVINTPEPQVFMMKKSIDTKDFVGSMLTYSLETPVVIEDNTEYVLAFTGSIEGIYQVDTQGNLNVYNPWDYGEDLYVLTLEFFD